MKVETLSSDDEEQKPSQLAASMDEEFAAQIDEVLHQSLVDQGLAPPSVPHNRDAQNGPAMNKEPLSPPCNLLGNEA